MYRRHLRSIASRIQASFHEYQIVLVGHSAGAASATFIADVLSNSDIQVKGLVYADGVDSPNRLIAKYLGRLDDLRVSAVLAPPSSCNRQGKLEHRLISHPRVEVNVIQGAGHGDIEGSGVQVYRKFCADTSTEEVAHEFRQALIRQIELSI
jgi:Lipase (class 3)